jgi:hypothetical protein
MTGAGEADFLTLKVSTQPVSGGTVTETSFEYLKPILCVPAEGIEKPAEVQFGTLPLIRQAV